MSFFTAWLKVYIRYGSKVVLVVFWSTTSGSSSSVMLVVLLEVVVVLVVKFSSKISGMVKNC